MMQDLGPTTASVLPVDPSPAGPLGPAGYRPQPSQQVVGDPVPEPTPATLRAYAADWTHFVAWCRTQGCVPLPASPQTVAAYLLAAAPGLSRGSLGRRRAAIGTTHRQAALPIPLLDAATQATLRSRAKPKTPRSALPTKAGLQRMATACPRDLPGLRDRALLLLAAALTRPGRRPGDPGRASEGGAIGKAVPRLFLLALDAEHVCFIATGMTLQIHSRADEAAPRRAVTLTRAMTAESCPVRAMEDWLRASDTGFGPVFRKVDRWGNVEHGRLHPDAWNRILAQRGGPPRRSRTPARPNR